MSNKKIPHILNALSIPMLVLLCSCTGILPVSPTATPKAPIVLENKGQACFYPLSPSKLRVGISTYPFACLPSSCTEVFERTGNIEVDANNFVIQLYSRFVALSVSDVPLPSGEPRVCAADCGGAGFLDFETGELKSGTYTVKLGKESVGSVEIPFRMNHVCFDNYKWPTPLPSATYSGPTATPWPSPLQPISPLPTPLP